MHCSLGGNIGNVSFFLLQPIPEPKDRRCVLMEEYWLSQGEMEPAVDPFYIHTPAVKLNLRDLARVVSAG